MSACPPQEILNALFPPERSGEFFEALYGDAEDGAYQIKLICRGATPDRLDLAFALERKPGQCLRCNLTHGLPKVFEKHPVINIGELARQLADMQGWANGFSWKLGETIEESEDLHMVPFALCKARAE